MRNLTCLLALLAVFAATRSSLAVIVAGDSPSGPSITTAYNGGLGGFTVAETVAYSGAAGSWQKALVNSGQMILSGQEVPVHEQLTNGGPSAWTGWHEAVLADAADAPFPDFLFTAGSLQLDRNGVPLNQGADYTLTAMTANPGLGISPGGDWVALSILFKPSAEIQPGDTLGIRKRIFEVFLDGDTWDVGESALLGENPTAVPEPTSISLASLGGVGLSLLWLKRRRRRHGPSG